MTGTRRVRSRSVVAVVLSVWLCAAGAGAAVAQPVADVSGAPVPAASDPTGPGPGWGTTFHELVPTRILDSRTGVPGLGSFGGALGPGLGAAKDLSVAGVGGVGTSAEAVVLNVTVTGGTAPSFLSVYPSDGATPKASNINFGPGQTIANAVTVKVGATGAVRFANASGTVHVVADVVGWFDDTMPPGTLYNAVGPTRILDSRGPVGGWNHKLGAGTGNAQTLTVTGSNGVPLAARSVVLNVTATGSDAGSFVQVWPSDAVRPTSSNLNFGAGQTIANLVSTPVSASGQISFFNAVGSTDLVVDVLGYFDPTQGANFHVLEPTRVLDDRTGTGLAGSWGPGQSRSFAVGGAPTIPATATGIVANLTATNGSAGTYATLRAAGTGVPATSTLNAGPHETIANLAFSRLDGAGHASLFNAQGTVDLVLDVAGYFDGDAKARPVFTTLGMWTGTATAYSQAGASSPFFTAADPYSSPVPGDYDGDGRWDVAVVDTSGHWITRGTAGTFDFPAPPPIVPSSTRKYVLPVPGAYDGTGKTLPAWYRDWDATWFIMGHDPIQFGEGPTDGTLPTGTGITQTDQDVPVPADYDGDGVTDLATYRPMTARWMIRRSSDNTVVTFTLGDPASSSPTMPMPADYDGQGHAQGATYDGTSAWRIQGHATADPYGAGDWGIPAPADYDGVGRAQLSYIAYPYSAPRTWRLQGYAQGLAAPQQYPQPLTFPVAMWINIARLTFLAKCVGGTWPCT